MNKLIKYSFLGSMLLTQVVDAKNVAIVGAKVHTMSSQGTVDNATVLIKDGKIQSVMEGEPALAGYEIIDAKGKVVTPGLIGASTSLGLVDVGFSAGTNDSNSSLTSISKTGAAFDVSYAINPESSLMAIARIEGVTSAATSMGRTGQLFNGQGALISLGDSSDPIIQGRAFISTRLGNNGADTVGGSRSVLWVSLETALAEAKFAIGKSLTPIDEWHGELSRADIAALIPVVKGEVPLLVDARRAADIRQVIALKQRQPQLNIVITYATEGWRVAKELADNNIPVILDPEANLPFGFDQLGSTLENAGRLAAAGVEVSIGMETHNIRLARQHAGNAVANGLSWDQGLAALTINVAKLYGIDDKLGSLDSGKIADVVIWSGDPLEVTEAAELVLISGEKVDMHSRQSKLRDRYLKLQTDKPMQYVRP
ncbi:amidohydrolase family protein [Paraglaciecola sp. MB-3u-78]|jgi:imidazolonepropionase-like amidohydrolase|uniref:amidohydrolase family protein n=1 Tax=Paraglaciecola sp. MB-3u-78 TaxID=2058332 RepID=UPI000C328109|nr:amidohydrolase family protein [Paraglaciecola sp. MB-3u-78]PKG97151.1 amidohydrolase [Paraglaciecola sp. MB-3u-78]